MAKFYSLMYKYFEISVFEITRVSCYFDLYIEALIGCLFAEIILLKFQNKYENPEKLLNKLPYLNSLSYQTGKKPETVGNDR